MSDWMLDGGTRAVNGGGEAGNSKATDDTDYSNVAARRLTRCAKIAVLFVSISDAPWQGN